MADTPASTPSCDSIIATTSGKNVVWFSLDPRTGDVNFYPAPLTALFEEKYQGDDAEWEYVPLGEFGGVFRDAALEIGGGRPPIQIKASGGKRDVRRMEVPADAAEVVVRVHQGRTWRIAKDGSIHSTKELRVPITQADPCIMEDQTELQRKNRAEAVAAASEPGMATLWEWCRVTEGYNLDLPSEQWGVYNEEQNAAIEAAFAAGQPSVSVCIGVRRYELVFDGTTGGKQVDTMLKKRRLVRRRIVKSEEFAALSNGWTAKVRNAASNVTAGECAVCCEEFAATPTLPIVQLPGCGHSFHGACVQALADENKNCPLCRDSVDWRVALTSQSVTVSL